MNQTTQTKRIEAYSIADFVKQIEDAILEGFRLNLEDNEKYPLQIGVGFYATMDKAKDVAVRIINESAIPFKISPVSETEREVIIQDAVELLQPTKPGRKPKN